MSCVCVCVHWKRAWDQGKSLHTLGLHLWLTDLQLSYYFGSFPGHSKPLLSYWTASVLTIQDHPFSMPSYQLLGLLQKSSSRFRILGTEVRAQCCTRAKSSCLRSLCSLGLFKSFLISGAIHPGTSDSPLTFLQLWCFFSPPTAQCWWSTLSGYLKNPLNKVFWLFCWSSFCSVEYGTQDRRNTKQVLYHGEVPKWGWLNSQCFLIASAPVVL